MTFRGKVKDGIVVLDEPGALPEGAKVSVRILKDRGGPGSGETRPKSLYERLEPIVGIAKGLPRDLARNHDHYLHGRPRK